METSEPETVDYLLIAAMLALPVLLTWILWQVHRLRERVSRLEDWLKIPRGL